jgi:enterobacterial common antigen flippase
VTAAENRVVGPAGPLEAIVTLGAIQILVMVAGIVRTKILALLLGPSGLGIVGVIDQIVVFIAHAGSMSLPFAALRYLSRHRGESPERFASLYIAFRRALLAASAFSVLLGLGLLVWKTRQPSNDLAPYRLAVIIGVFSAPAIALLALDRNVLAVFDRSRHAAVVALVAGIALIGSSLVGVRLGGLGGLYAGNLLVNIALASLLSRYVRAYLIPHEAHRPLPPSTLRTLRAEPGLVKFCTWIHALTLASPAAYLVSRIVLLDSRGSVEAGLMAAAFGFGVAVRTAMGQANALYLTPLANRSTPMSDRADAVSHYARTLTVLFLLGVLPIILFPRPLLRVLYSHEFLAAGGAIGAFLIAEGLLLMAGVYQSLLIGFDDLNGYMFTSLAANVTTIVASVALIPAHGIIGAALAFIGGNCLLFVLTLLRLRASHSISGLVRQTGVFWLGMLSLAVAAWWASGPGSGTVLPRFAICFVGWAALLPMLSRAELRRLLAPWSRDAVKTGD